MSSRAGAAAEADWRAARAARPSNRRSMRRTLEHRLLIGLALVLAVAGFAVDRLLEREFVDLFDQRLVGLASAMRTNIEQEPDGIDIDLPADLLLSFRRDEDADSFRLWDDAGNELARSESAIGHALTRGPTPLDEPVFETRRLIDDLPVRIMRLSFLPALDSNDDGKPVVFPADFVRRPVHLSLASPAGPLVAEIWELRAILAAIAALSLAATALIIHRGLRDGLAPLEDVRNQIDQLRGSTLGSRLTLPDGASELAVVVDQLNALLTRLSTAMARERQFSHDVAHELRTPLAELRAVIDIGSRWPDDPALASRFYEDARGACAQMESTVNNLLALARSEQGSDLLDPTPFELNAVIAQPGAAQRLRTVARQPGRRR
ncbi:MAG: sensor histidine kinase N-terminal domain-containing protein [Burkholderiaceae bacterium]